MPRKQKSEDELKRLQEQHLKELFIEFNKKQAVKNQREYEREVYKVSRTSDRARYLEIVALRQRQGLSTRM